jgi:hypothetical protein
MTDQDLENRFTYHSPKEGQAERYETLRRSALLLAKWVNVNVPESREKSLAITHLEDFVMWSNSGIARNE